MLELEPGSVEHVSHPEEPPHGPWGTRLFSLTRLFAMVGGSVFVALIGMSLVSIIGRKLFALPIPGDLEIMQMGAAVASAAFFPYCQMNDGQVKVDFFTTWLPSFSRALLDAMASMLLTGVVLVIAWRTAVAAVASKESGEASLMLGWPVWIAIALIVPSFILFAVAGFYMTRKRLKEAIAAVLDAQPLKRKP